MGILDDLLGGLAGQAAGDRAQQQQTRAPGGGAGMSQMLMALMPIVLLPEVVDRMTPDGTVPDADALAKSVDDFVRRLGPS